MDGILDKVHEAGLTLKAGCGIGYEFSHAAPARRVRRRRRRVHLRPDVLHGYLRQDVLHRVLAPAAAAARRWAPSTSSHPDVKDFIRAKREDGRLRQFNLSLLITDGFMDAVETDADWPLVFPINIKEQRRHRPRRRRPGGLARVAAPTSNYVTRDDGLVACKIYGHIRARHLWDMIMVSTYDYAEPGFILIDRVNEMNNNWWCENIRATNPCGEQPLPPYGACLLGSVNLTKFVRNPFTDQASFDWEEYKEVVRVFTRMLDNVVEVNGLPLEQQRDEILRKRRHGMGFLGLGSTLTMLQMKYGSPESCEFTERIAREMAVAGWEMGLALAKEKGAAPIMDERLRRSPPRCCASARKWRRTAGSSASRSRASVLHAKY